MRYYYFTRSNGDLDTLSEKTVADFNLTTLAKKRDFVGDSGATGFILSEPIPHAKIDASIVIKDTEKEKAEYKKEAERLYNEKSQKRHINGYDLSNTFEFDFQRRKGGQVIIKKVSGGVEVKNKAETDQLEEDLHAYLVSVANAYKSDIDAIESGNYLISALKSI